MSTKIALVKPCTRLFSRLQKNQLIFVCRSAQYSTEEEKNKNYACSSVTYNRNPRNLEFLGHAPKQIGWRFQYPRKDYYHKLVLEKTNTNITGRVEHFSGKTVISASTKEWAIKEQLYSCTDVSAAENIGRVLAQRCNEFGITNIFYDPKPEDAKSERTQAFLTALKEGNVVFWEPEGYQPTKDPGVNYDGKNRVGEEKKMLDDYQYE